jgi:peptidoglycan/LPS O-acetylase OafA/YrhL
MFIVAAAQSRWKSPLLLFPLVTLGRRSYEVYSTHMFVVFAFLRIFALFTSAGASMRLVPILFFGVIVTSHLLGGVVARFKSAPMNRLIRRCVDASRTEPERLGPVIAFRTAR